jgi:hypothetical protein
MRNWPSSNPPRRAIFAVIPLSARVYIKVNYSVLRDADTCFGLALRRIMGLMHCTGFRDVARAALREGGESVLARLLWSAFLPYSDLVV